MLDDYRLEKTHLSVVPLEQADDDAPYWRAQGSQERLRAMQFMRELVYGYDAANARLQRVLTVAQLGED